MPLDSPPWKLTPLDHLNTWFRSLGRWEQAAVATWSIAILVVSILAFCFPRKHSVYPLYSEAAQNWLSGASAYDAQSGLYRYSPCVTVFLIPLSILPDSLGAVFWRWLNAAAMIAALAWWSRKALPLPLTRAQQALLFLLVAPPVIGNLHNGQSNLLVLALLLAAAAGAVEERWNLAAVCIALACLFKIYPIALGLLLATAYPRRFAGRFFLALGAGLLLPFLFQRPDYVFDQYLQWFGHIRKNDRQELQVYLWYRDLRQLISVWITPVSLHAYQAVQCAAAAACAGFVLAARRRGWPKRRLSALVFSLSCCWMTVLGPATESCTYVLIAPAGAWAGIEAFQERRAWALRSAFLSGYTLLMISQLAVWFPFGRAFHSLGPQPLAGLLILLGLTLRYAAELAGSTPPSFANIERPSLAA